ncbi:MULTISPECIES: exo-alpha-sialidase [unclassified Streptococcus]|uniref:sialidase family protein n=1 Tax=unclassified Streptococcus TaxID=2608887 RepID=UPI00107187B3|nr:MULTISPECIES: exo-alpha-sialidase [unclassified Streptococcus]MBF0786879.1 exo-alpha-sialidase [Streptococcus sp. 19428wC2_LYSM12]MCQ9212710.1 exo-alpha-sialidase [Streptococcus sp. B01]MCQ9214051.1 exo-alpha-sialidase [Streptococcus sp. O1]TFV06248.1 sialidase [Streptococcus sp. LYSM12]
MKHKKIYSSLGLLLVAGTVLVTVPTTIVANAPSITQVVDTPVYQTGPIDLNKQGSDITSSVLENFKSDTQSIAVRFSSNNANALQALVGISNASRGFRNHYFSIFIRDTGEVGVEIRDAKKGINYLFARPASLWGQHKGQDAENMVVFVSNATEKTYTMYVNGTKVFTETVENFLPITGIGGQNTVTLGGVNREGKIDYGMTGRIESVSFYNKAFSPSEAQSFTASAPHQLIFQSGDSTQANYFRIPALYTLDSGRVLASIDARYGGTHDSRSKINIATSFSDNNGESWSEPNLAMKFNDYAEQLVEWPRKNQAKNSQINGSASFIDSALVQDKQTGKVVMLADVMPAGIGNNNAVKTDSGFKEIDGHYFVKLKKEGDTHYQYSIREDGQVYDDTRGQPTPYSVNSKYELFENGQPLTVEQYSVAFNGESLNEFHNGTLVPMNIFYKDSLFKVAPTNYIGVATSDDGGESWSDFKLLPPFLGVDHNATYLSPGQGLALKNSKRLVFATYTRGELTYLITEDAGQTWKKASAPVPFTNATAEAQMVELRDGVIRTFFRTTTGKIAYMTSYDAGDTWSDVSYLDIVKQTNYGTQVSVIKYSQLIDGKEAVLLSTPNSRTGRKGGQIWVGLMNPADDTIDWKYHYDVDLPEYGYAYSAITELPNHHIGVLFEKYDSWSRNELHLTNVVQYIDLEINDLLK